MKYCVLFFLSALLTVSVYAMCCPSGSVGAGNCGPNHKGKLCKGGTNNCTSAPEICCYNQAGHYSFCYYGG